MDMGNWTWEKRLGVSLLALVAIGAVTGGIYYVWLNTPPPPPTTPQQALAVIGSVRFEHMPQYRKDEYLQQTTRLMETMTPEERQTFFKDTRQDENARKNMGQVMQQMMTQRAMQFANAAPEERLTMIDADIDRMEAMRAMGGWAGRPGGPGGAGTGTSGDAKPASEADGSGGKGGPGRPGESPGGDDKSRAERIKGHISERIQNGNPQVNSLMGEYFRAIHERRLQRGLPDDMGPPGRPGGGGR